MQAELICHQLDGKNVAIAQKLRNFIQVVILPQLQKALFWPSTWTIELSR